MLDENINYHKCLSYLDKQQEVKFVIIPFSENEYRIHTINEKGKHFIHLVDIIDEESAKKLVGDDLIFVHVKQFTGGCKTVESAIKVVQESLRVHHNNTDNWILFKAIPGLFASVGVRYIFKYIGNILTR